MAESVPGTSDVDVAIGIEIKRRRLQVSMTQEELGASSGVTFQQIQKYERGVNRVSASRLQRIAATLGCSMADLMGAAADGPSAAPADSGFAALPAVRALGRSFERLTDDRQREAACIMMAGLAKLLTEVRFGEVGA